MSTTAIKDNIKRTYNYQKAMEKGQKKGLRYHTGRT